MANSPDSGILEDFISLFFPRYCLGCHRSLVKGENLVCTKCMLEMPRSFYHLDPANPFFQKFSGRLPVTRVMTQFKFVKESRVQHLLHALKYRHQPELGEMLGRVYGQDLLEADLGQAFDLILPVPLHSSRRRIRGYNQSEKFGRGLADMLGIPCIDTCLKRVARTETQTRKSRLHRWENVSNIFKVTDARPITGRRVLLVDDVVTTGSTLEACGRVILDAGCAELSIACIAGTQ